MPIYTLFIHLAEETITHAIIDYTKYDQERQYMKEELRKKHSQAAEEKVTNWPVILEEIFISGQCQ